MFFRRCIMYLIVIITSASCGTGKQLSAPAWYNNPEKLDTTRLHFDGYYTNVSKTGYPYNKYLAVNPVIFTAQNQLVIFNGSYPDSTLFECAFYKKYVAPADLGKFFIEGNTIHAFLPVTLPVAGGSFYRDFNLHFTGTIVNKDSIINWKIIPPFPHKLRRKNNFANLKETTVFKGYDLKFIPADAVRCLPN